MKTAALCLIGIIILAMVELICLTHKAYINERNCKMCENKDKKDRAQSKKDIDMLSIPYGSIQTPNDKPSSGNNEDTSGESESNSRPLLISRIALVISILAVFISSVTLYLEHLKSFSLMLEEGANISIRAGKYKDKERNMFCVPVIFINNGAVGGTIKAFEIYIKCNNNQMEENSTIILESPTMENIGRNVKVFRSFYLKGKTSVHKILATTIKTPLAGKYTCELVAALPRGKNVTKTFKFTLDEEQIKGLRSGNIINTPMDELKPLHE